MNGNNDFAVMKFQFMAKLTIFILGLSFLYFFAVTFIEIPGGNIGNSNTIVGFIILTVGVISGYYFGSSQSTGAMAKRDLEQSPIDAAAKEAAAKVEADRIAAAKENAAKVEEERIKAAKVEGDKVIEAAKVEIKP